MPILGQKEKYASRCVRKRRRDQLYDGCITPATDVFDDRIDLVQAAIKTSQYGFTEHTSKSQRAEMKALHWKGMK